MHFSEEFNEWYRTVWSGTQPSPWEILVEDINVRYKMEIVKHPMDEFKRLHQMIQ
jgi:hypothetical protein